jgi:drug/metabolite transporter (DMT)-like permease
MLLAGTRCVVAGAILTLVATMLGRRPGLRGNVGRYGTLMLLNVLGLFGLQTLAIDHLPSGVASVLLYLQPVLTVLLAGPLLGETLRWQRVLGAVLAFAGVAVMSFHPNAALSTLGVALGVGAALCWSLGTISAKRSAPFLEPLWAVGLPLLVGGAAMFAFALVAGQTAVDGSSRVWFGWAWTTFAGTAFAWLLWMFLVTSGEVGRVAVSIFLVPVTAVLFGAWVLDESLDWGVAVGTVLVCAGVLLVNWYAGGRAAGVRSPVQPDQRGA